MNTQCDMTDSQNSGLSSLQQHQMFKMLCKTTTQNCQLIGRPEYLIEQYTLLSRQLSEMKDILKTHREIPAQVLLQSPVILFDARGRISPFHLDFISSLDAFMAVLCIRFHDLGLEKIESEEFSLEDAARGHEIDLRLPWAGLFEVSL